MQHTLDFLLTVEPEPAVMSESVDFFGNLTTHFTLQEPHRKLVILSEHRTEVLTGSTPDPAGTIPWEEAAARIRMARDPAALMRSSTPSIPLMWAGMKNWPRLHEYLSRPVGPYSKR